MNSQNQSVVKVSFNQLSSQLIINWLLAALGSVPASHSVGQKLMLLTWRRFRKTGSVSSKSKRISDGKILIGVKEYKLLLAFTNSLAAKKSCRRKRPSGRRGRLANFLVSALATSPIVLPSPQYSWLKIVK